MMVKCVLEKACFFKGSSLFFYRLSRHNLSRVSPTQPATECGLNGRHLWREVDWLLRHFAVRDAFGSSCRFVVEVKVKKTNISFFTGHISIRVGW